MTTIGHARTGMDVGYARVSTGKQTLDLQQDALQQAGCGKVFTETASGAKADRPVLEEALADLRPGGKLVLHACGALAEFERDLIRERTHAGPAAARARGRIGRRQKALADLKQVALAQALYDGGRSDVATIRTTLGISRPTFYRYLDRRRERQFATKNSDR